MALRDADQSLSGAALIFDLDGTLFDTSFDLAAAMNIALDHFGYQAIEPARVRDLVGFGARAMLERGFLIERGEPADEVMIDQAREIFLDYYQRHIAVHTTAFPHVIEMIEGYRRKGAKIAICTNKREDNARALVRELGYFHLFDAIVGGDTALAAKPDPAPVRLALELLGEKVDARRAIFIGDSDTDIGASVAAGLPILVASFGYGPVTRSTEVIGIFDHYRDCEEMINAIW